METRLARSRTDRLIAGVGGGIGEYFQIDPVIVRLLFVLVTLTSGLGLPMYAILWIVMPRQSWDTSAQGNAFSSDPALHQAHTQATYAPHEMPTQAAAQHAWTPHSAGRAPVGYAPDDRSGASAGPPTSGPLPADNAYTRGETGLSTGQTIRLDESVAPNSPVPQPHSNRQRRSWRSLGFILVGFGVLLLLEELFGVSMALLFPLLLIIAGVVLVRRGRQARF